MQSLTWFLPILPGKTQAWLDFNATVHGSRVAEYEASRRRMGILREVISLQRTERGDLIVVFDEAEDLVAAWRALATSADPFDVWYRDGMIEFGGLTVDMYLGGLPAVLRSDWSAT